jgi:N-acetylmuramoyl-L-alanine amidase
MKNQPTHILVHCSDSAGGTRADIDQWHKERGFGGIGYHYVVLNGSLSPGGKNYVAIMDGHVDAGRPESQVGAHCPPFNARSIGICAIGKRDLFTAPQLAALDALISRLCKAYKIPSDRVIGHCEADPASKKTCPEMDMTALRERVAALNAKG